MTERGCRLIGAAIIVAAGGIVIGLFDVARCLGQRFPPYSEGVGFTMLLAGAGLFLLDWARSFREALNPKIE